MTTTTTKTISKRAAAAGYQSIELPPVGGEKRRWIVLRHGIPIVIKATTITRTILKSGREIITGSVTAPIAHIAPITNGARAIAPALARGLK